LTVLLFCFALGWFTLLADEFTALNKHIAAGLAFVSNLVLLGESGYFDSASHNKILLHLWSLGIEEQFYIFWPLLLLIFWRLRLKLGILLWGLLLCSFLLNIALIHNYPSATFYLPFTRVWELLIGAALAYRVAIQNKPVLLWG
jgi:peptidoglycan/LPS O-acetylase OafA/YrhL